MQFNIVSSIPEKKNAIYLAKPLANSTLLFLTANPEDTQAIKINKEFNEVQDAAESAILPLNIKLRLDVGRKELVEIFLRDKPSILHFSGHGLGDKGLVLQHENGASELVSTEALAALMAEFSDSLHCIVLNACYSVEQAKALSVHIPFVIGIDNAIGDTKAIAFSEAFYTCLFLGEGYESAFRKAIVQVGLDALDAGAQPILYRWDPAAAENTMTTLLEKAAAPDGYVWVRPVCYPKMQFLMPKKHNVTQNDAEYFSSEDDYTDLAFGLYGEKASITEIFEGIFEEEDFDWWEEEDVYEEEVNGIVVSWIKAFEKGFDSHLIYLFTFLNPEGDPCWATVSHLDGNSHALKTADTLFYSFKFVD